MRQVSGEPQYAAAMPRGGLPQVIQMGALGVY
jgi:hypothetical protein